MLISAIATEVMEEVGADTSDTTLQTKIIGFIKSVLRRFPDGSRNRTLIGVTTMSLTATAQTTTLPSGCVAVKNIWIPGTSDRKNLTIVKDRKIFNHVYTSSTGGKPENCYIYGTTVEYDRPADQAYTVYIEHYKEVDNVSSGDTFAHDSAMAEMVKDGVKSYYYNYTEEENQFAYWSKIFNNSLEKLEARYNMESMPDHVEESS